MDENNKRKRGKIKSVGKKPRIGRRKQRVKITTQSDLERMTAEEESRRRTTVPQDPILFTFDEDTASISTPSKSLEDKLTKPPRPATHPPQYNPRGGVPRTLNSQLISILKLMKHREWSPQIISETIEEFRALTELVPAKSSLDFLKHAYERGHFEKTDEIEEGYDRRFAFKKAVRSIIQIESACLTQSDETLISRYSNFADTLYDIYGSWTDSPDLGACMEDTVDHFMELAIAPPEVQEVFEEINRFRAGNKSYTRYESMNGVAKAFASFDGIVNDGARQVVLAYAAIDQTNEYTDIYSRMLSLPAALPKEVINLILDTITPYVAGPSRSKDRRRVLDATRNFVDAVHQQYDLFGDEGVSHLGQDSMHGQDGGSGVTRLNELTKIVLKFVEGERDGVGTRNVFEESKIPRAGPTIQTAYFSELKKLETYLHSLCAEHDRIEVLHMRTLDEYDRLESLPDSECPTKKDDITGLLITLGNIEKRRDDKARKQTEFKKKVNTFKRNYNTLWDAYINEDPIITSNGLYRYVKAVPSIIRGAGVEESESESLKEIFIRVSELRDEKDGKKRKRIELLPSRLKTADTQETEAVHQMFGMPVRGVYVLDDEMVEWYNTPEATNCYLQLLKQHSQYGMSPFIKQAVDIVIDELKRETAGYIGDSEDLELILKKTSLDGKTVEILSLGAGTGTKEKDIIIPAFLEAGCRPEDVHVTLVEKSRTMQGIAAMDYTLDDIPHKIEDVDFRNINPSYFGHLNPDVLLIPVLGGTVLNLTSNEAIDLYALVRGIMRNMKPEVMNRSYCLTEVNRSKSLRVYRDPLSKQMFSEFLRLNYDVQPDEIAYAPLGEDPKPTHFVIQDGHKFNIYYFVNKQSRHFKPGYLIKLGFSGYENPSRMKKNLKKIGLSCTHVPPPSENSRSAVIISKYTKKPMTDWIPWRWGRQFKGWGKE